MLPHAGAKTFTAIVSEISVFQFHGRHVTLAPRNKRRISVAAHPHENRFDGSGTGLNNHTPVQSFVKEGS